MSFSDFPLVSLVTVDALPLLLNPSSVSTLPVDPCTSYVSKKHQHVCYVNLSAWLSC